MMSRVAAIARYLALAALGAHLLLALTQSVSRSFVWVRQGLSTLGWDASNRRRAALGDAWVDSIAAARQAIPRDGEYCLVNGSSEKSGAPLWVRFDLAPRRAHLVGRMEELAGAVGLDSRIPAACAWVVVAFPSPLPPRLLPRAALLRELEPQPQHGAP